MDVKVLWRMDEEAIRWQQCAICGVQQQQRVVRTAGRPDYAVCNHCHSAFVLEDGGQMRMMYGRVMTPHREVKDFALRQWVRYFDLRAKVTSVQKRELDVLPAELKPDDKAVHGVYGSAMDAILSLEAEKAALLYDQAKVMSRPPARPLRETGELPNLDDLFRDR